jgi:hypothetical protein
MGTFFSIDCERSTIYIYIFRRGGFCVEKTVFFFFLGFVLYIFKRNFFCVFFWLS